MPSGLHWESSDMNATFLSLESDIDKIQPVIDSLSTAIKALQGDIGEGQALSGSAYTKVSNSLSNVVLPVVQAFNEVTNAIQIKNQKLKRTSNELEQHVIY